MPKRRTFAAKQHQAVYDELRTMRPDPERVRGMGGGGNAYAVGYTRPDEPNHLFPRGSRAYAHWAAGVDNARDDAKQSAKVKPADTPTTRHPQKPLAERIADADALASRWLANGNKAAESGNHARAEECYAKAQHWKDRYNLLTGAGARPAPKA